MVVAVADSLGSGQAESVSGAHMSVEKWGLRSLSLLKNSAQILRLLRSLRSTYQGETSSGTELVAVLDQWQIVEK